MEIFQSKAMRVRRSASRSDRSDWAGIVAGIVGGDLVASPQWVVSVTALGDLGARDLNDSRTRTIADGKTIRKATA